MSDFFYANLIQNCEELIRSGKADAASKALHDVKLAEVPRPFILALANLARRAGLNPLGLKILGSVVLEDKAPIDQAPATEAELAEYAVLLHRHGALDEALDILESLDDQKIPAVLLYKAFCYFNEFDHANATEVLLKYVQCESEPYLNLVGQVNLAASYVLGYQHEEAFAILKNTIHAASQGGHKRLAGNSLELRAQLHLRERNFTRAQEDLNVAADLIREFQSLDFLWLQKWQALLEDLRSGQSDQLQAFRIKAMAAKSWENVREADRFLLSVSFDPRKFDFLIFGTPYPKYRNLIFKETGKFPSSEHFTLGNPSAAGLDLSSGTSSGARILPPGKQAHRLLAILASDFYRPFLVGEMFGHLFENEHFNIFTSPNRVHQLVRRTRQQLQKLNVPLEILQLEGRYKLEVPVNYSLRVPLEAEPIDVYHLQWKKYVQAFQGKKPLSALEARTHLKMSRTSFQRLVNWAVQNGHLEKSGDHKFTLYQMKAA